MVQLNSLEPGHIADTAQIAHFTDSTFDHHDHHDIPGIGLLRLNDPHPGGSSVTAGAHGRLSAHGLKKIPALLAKLPAKLHRQTTGHSVASTTPTQSSNSLVMEHSRSSSMTTTTLPASAPIRAAMRRAASASVSGARPPVPSAMSTVAVSAPTAKSAQPSMEHVHVPASAPSTQPDPHVDVHAGSGDDHADGDIETVLPLQRYNASAVAVKGSYLVPRPGNYIFVFDK